MTIEPIADFKSPLKDKFGIPRQSGLVDSLKGKIVFRKEYRSAEALKGLEDFDYIWIIWGFSANMRCNPEADYGCPRDKTFVATVRPPRLGGNKSMGVFATRSPYRPNPLGLSLARIGKIDSAKMEIEVHGADLMDGTPVYDIKPYIVYSDSRPDARSGFVDKNPWKPLQVIFPEELKASLTTLSGEEGATDTVTELLAQDPRPHYHDDPDKIYGMTYRNVDVKFIVSGNILRVTDIVPAPQSRKYQA